MSQNLDDDLENIPDDGVDNLDDLVLDDDVDNDTLATSTNVLFDLLILKPDYTILISQIN